MLRELKLLGGNEKVFFSDPEIVLFVTGVGFSAAFGEDLLEKAVKVDLLVGRGGINGELICNWI